MLGFATTQMVPDLMALWSAVFGDSDAYIKLYFENRFVPQNTLVYLENNRPVGMVSMLPVTLRNPLDPLSGQYIYAVATHPEYRGKGVSSQLMEFAHKTCLHRGVDVTLLVPAEKSLFEFYNERGYHIAFNTKQRVLTPEEIGTTDPIPKLKATSLLAQEEMRNRHFGRSHLFAKWDKHALSYQDMELTLTGAQVFAFDEAHGYALCVRQEDTIYIKELVLEGISLTAAAVALHEQYGAKSYHIRAWEDEQLEGAVLPFAMIKWHNEKKQELLSDVAGKAPYLALVLD